MHFEGMDLNLLVTLDVLLEERSVTRAATRLFVSQPAMSAALQRLRYHFSDSLFEKVGRRLELTPRARTLVQPLRALLIDIRSTLDATPAFDPASSRRSFRLSMSSFVAELLVPRLFHAISRQAPYLQLEVEYLTSNMFSRLQSGLIDCCITVHDVAYFDPGYDQDDFASDFLFRDPFVLVASEDNALAFDGMSYEELCALPLVIVRVGERVRSVVERSIERFAKRPNTFCVIPSYGLAMQMLTGSGMVAIARSRIADAYRTQCRLKTVAPPLDLPILEDALIWHSRTDADPGHIWLRDLIRNTAMQLA
jgi:DNA-binding transcriptional LysR family regulator